MIPESAFKLFVGCISRQVTHVNLARYVTITIVSRHVFCNEEKVHLKNQIRIVQSCSYGKYKNYFPSCDYCAKVVLKLYPGITTYASAENSSLFA